MNRSLVYLLGVFLILNSISAQEITLNSLNVTPNILCLDKDNFFDIQPLDLNDNFTRVNNITLLLPASLKSGGIFESNNTYQVFISTTLNTRQEQRINFTVYVEQFGKTITQNVTLSLKDCRSFKEKSQSFFGGVDNFLSDNKGDLIITFVFFCLILLFYFLISRR